MSHFKYFQENLENASIHIISHHKAKTKGSCTKKRFVHRHCKPTISSVASMEPQLPAATVLEIRENNIHYITE